MTADDAVQQILAAACGYARLEGRHVCKVSYRADQGCDPMSWRMLHLTVEGIVRQLAVDLAVPAVAPVSAGQLPLGAP